MTDRLNDFVTRTRAAMAASDSGPLIVARDVMAIADNWERYKEEAGGLDCSRFLTSTFGAGRGLAYFANRVEAVAFIGESARRTLHHQVAIYILNNVSKEFVAEVLSALTRERKKNGGNALSPAQAKPVIEAITGTKQRAYRTCSKCVKLEAELAKLRGEVTVEAAE